MKTNRIVRIRMLAVLMSLAMGAAPTLGQSPARQKQVSVQPVAAAPKAQPTAKRASGPQEGIKVHGHWLIEIRNPDGSLASRSEFENALEPQGMFILAGVMGGGFSVSNWRLIVRSTTASLCPSQSQPNNFGQGACIMAPPSDTGVTKQSNDLTSRLVGTDPNGGGFVEVKGSFTAEAEATIDFVRSGINAGGFYFFSSKTLAPADQRHVVAGQIVQVILTISFS